MGLQFGFPDDLFCCIVCLLVVLRGFPLDCGLYCCLRCCLFRFVTMWLVIVDDYLDLGLVNCLFLGCYVCFGRFGGAYVFVLFRVVWVDWFGLVACRVWCTFAYGGYIASVFFRGVVFICWRFGF